MLAVEDRLRHTGRHPSTMNGISKRLLRTEILKLVARLESGSATNDASHEVGRLLQSLDEPRIPGLSVFPELYVMSVVEREGIYRTMQDPHLDVELLGPHTGDTVFYAMSLVLEDCYGLTVEIPKADEAYKWRILLREEKAGDMAYDIRGGHRVPRLRATLRGRTIAFCYRPVGLVVRTRIHFNPPFMRQQIRTEVLPTFCKKEDEFMWMLRTKPREFLGHLESTLMANDRI
jgi:hypothetical protein